MRQLEQTQISTNAKLETLLDYDQKLIHQTRIKYNYTCKLINACNSIGVNQWNETVENWDLYKCFQSK